jgi:hypothetical protein
LNFLQSRLKPTFYESIKVDGLKNHARIIAATNSGISTRYLNKLMNRYAIRKEQLRY